MNKRVKKKRYKEAARAAYRYAFPSALRKKVTMEEYARVFARTMVGQRAKARGECLD